MSQYKRLPKLKQQRGGDEFVSAVDHAIRWFVQRRRFLIPLVLLIAAGLVGLYSLRLMREQKVFALNEALFKASVDPSKRDSLFEEILEKYGSSPASVVAPLSLAKGVFEKGDFASTLKYLEKAGKVSPEFLKPLITVARAEVLARSGDHEGGLKLLRTLAEGDPGVAGSYPKLLEAEILMEMGKRDEGEKILVALSSDIEEDRFVRSKARESLLRLKLEGGNP